MAASWPIVRLIVTSYAKDFVKERDILLKEIIPELKIWCENHQLQLQETDVRWGPGQSSSSIRSLLDEISQRYFNNDMPFFINITSKSLGLVPMWGEAPEPLINECMKRLRLTERDMEFLFAAYREDNNNCVFLIRDDEFLADLMSPEEKRHFISASILPKAALDISAKTLRRYPKERILSYSYDQAGYDHCAQKMVVDIQSSFSTQIPYKDLYQIINKYVKHMWQTSWDAAVNNILHEIKPILRIWPEGQRGNRREEVILPRVTKLMKQRLQMEFPTSIVPPDVYSQMRDAQEAFMKGRSHRLRGREDVISKIEDYVSEGGQDVPLLLVGGAGCGKSSVMARTADLTEQKAAAGLIPGGGAGGWHVFYHFVGAAPRSTELDFLLKRLCKELDIIHESALPNDLNAMAQLCCNALSNTNTRPVVIFIDALNQFDEDHAAVIMSWLPRKLAPHVRCILSLICDTPQHRTLMSRESKPQVLHMTPLDYEARRQIVQELLGQYRRTLTTDQLNSLLSKKTSENPLWLSMACEELRLVANPDDLTARIQALPDGLLNLLEDVLTRFASDRHGDLVTATLCLLEASATGLLEEELLTLLGDEQNVIPPSPFDEKDEKEDTEKDCEGEKGGKKKKSSALPVEMWVKVFNLLHPFLRPYGDSREGRLDFYHRAMSKAVRRKFFKQHDENTNDEEGEELSLFWHRRLAAYFEHCDNLDRKAEELLYHLCRINDIGRLIQCLTSWDMFDQLFNEEFSTQLLTYWRQVGGAGEMITEYKALLSSLEVQQPRDEELLAKRHQHIARIFLQAGKYSEALELATVALKLEEKDLGDRPERMVELYSLMSEIYDEKLKLNDFVSRSQLPDLRKTISYGRKSIGLRQKMHSDYHKLKLGLSLMKLAFSLESWEACGGDSHLSGEEALEQGNTHIDTALQIFKELKDDGHYAEALMTKGVLAPRGSMEQLKYYNEAMEICLQVYGEKSLLTSRLYINIGIVWEDNKDYVKAYEYFCKWCVVSEAVLGPSHPKTLRAKGVLKEPRYRLVALRVSEGTLSNNPGENNECDESTINREVEEVELQNEVAVNNDDIIMMDPEMMVQQLWPAGEDQGLENMGELREAINELLRAAISDGQLPVNLVTDPPQGNNHSDESVDDDEVEEVVRGIWTEDDDNRAVEGRGGGASGDNEGAVNEGNIAGHGVNIVSNVHIVPGVIVNNAAVGDEESVDNRDLEARETSGVGQEEDQQQQHNPGVDNNGDILYDNDAPH